MEELYKSIMNSNNEVVEIYLPGFKALEGNENGHATIWWDDENGDRHSMITLEKTAEILKKIP